MTCLWKSSSYTACVLHKTDILSHNIVSQCHDDRRARAFVPPPPTHTHTDTSNHQQKPCAIKVLSGILMACMQIASNKYIKALWVDRSSLSPVSSSRFRLLAHGVYVFCFCFHLCSIHACIRPQYRVAVYVFILLYFSAIELSNWIWIMHESIHLRPTCQSIIHSTGQRKYNFLFVCFVCCVFGFSAPWMIICETPFQFGSVGRVGGVRWAGWHFWWV